ncbi:MAG: helix-turn-helix transcriptional regulator, partial [Clostridia bacterium]|nr:helix-turn-helix transcriptional regulator [Clostridia bacterium]
LLCISAAVFLLAASPGYCDLYYKDVSLAIVDGVARLVKTYGKYHIVYLFYLLSYFASMIAIVAYVIIKKKITSHKYASMLTAVVFLNILIWGLEQLVTTEFEFLSISYIASEILLLFLFSIMQDFDELKNANNAQVAEISVVRTEADTNTEFDTEEKIDAEVKVEAEEKVETEPESEITISEQVPYLLEHWEVTEPLTSREVEVLRLLLDNFKRKEIAEKLYLSENTVKTHSSHIFTKLGVTNKSELIEKASSMLITK